MLPGQTRAVINKAIRESHVVIVCLSQNSTRHKGQLHKQISYALDIAEEQPEGTIFLIPAKLEECDIPDRLSGRRWVNLFESNGYELLLKSLRERANSIEDTKGETEFPGSREELNYQGDTPPRIALGHVPIPADPGLFVGRSQQMEILDSFWKDADIDIVQIVADGGVGKSTLVWHWLERRREESYQGIPQAIDWSFYSQGKRDYETDSHAFLDYAAEHLLPFGLVLPDESERRPEQMGNIIAHALIRVGGLIVLDGLEPLQYPPHVLAGALKDPGLVAFLRTLRSAPPKAADAPARLVLITTRWVIPQLKGRTVRTLDLDNLSQQDGAELLCRFRLPSFPSRALNLGANTKSARLKSELEKVSHEFSGHALALLLLASLLLRHYGGDLNRRSELHLESGDPFSDDPYRHAHRVMKSYDRMFVESGLTLDRACRQVLFLVGLFDRPIRLSLLNVIRDGSPIDELTDNLPDGLFNAAMEELRALRLLTSIPDYINEQLDTHPLIREHFGQTIRDKYPESWREAHLRLFNYLRESSAEFPEGVSEMDPLLQAVAHGCEAGLYGESYRDVYRKRIMRGEEAFAVVKLGLVAPIVTCLSHFFETGRWDKPLAARSPAEGLTDDEQLSLLLEVGNCLTAVKGYATTEVKQAFEAAIQLGQRLGKVKELYTAYHGLWRFTLVRGDCEITGQHARKLAHMPAPPTDLLEGMIVARVLSSTNYYIGRFRPALLDAESGIRLYRDTAAVAPSTLTSELLVMCLAISAMSLWHLGALKEARRRMAESVSEARKLDSGHTLVISLVFDTFLHQFVGDFETAAERSQEMCDLCDSHGLGSMAYLGMALNSLSVARVNQDSGRLNDVKEGIKGWRQTGAGLLVPYCLYRMAECHSIFGETKEAMEVINQAISLGDNHRERWWMPESYRLRAQLHRDLRADRTLILADLCDCLKLAIQNESRPHLRQGLEAAKTISRDSSITVPAELLEEASRILEREAPTLDIDLETGSPEEGGL